MLTYWFMYLISASMALLVSRKEQFNFMPWAIIGFIFILIIGFRDCVGCDWNAYLGHYQRMNGISIDNVLIMDDPLHKFLNWLMLRWDFGVYGVNTIYGTIFMIGLIKFSRE